ncbi:microsomal signal peptidase 12 kDa subunit [Aulographum hederae CBS 113979]|uniref:Signal peptidase complex subunit 1 n=1 Tax=Aulographum hederae CBS 113979 TaxID=1176131 RepID=A0A6G1GLU0_9PEZI|nr:microsomal signal peptidase 12 kDa subunit [Aulographum hederae CBS 113979]
MAEELLEKARDVFEGQIDFEGQRLAEYLTQGILTLVGAVAFLYGYFTQDIYMTLWIGLAGTALTFVAVVPPWPFFNKHPLQWLPPQNGYSGINIEVDRKKTS